MLKILSQFAIAQVIASLLLGCSSDNITTPVTKEAKYDIAAFVWPAFQPEPRWAELGLFYDGVGEWQNIYEATPRFKGHNQPRIPLWGYENEADAEVMEKKIDTATAYGVNVFIYDWYWFDGRPFLEEGLDSGFLKAKNNHKMKFYIMWANHNVDSTWNNKVADKNANGIFWKGEVCADEFRKIADRVVDKYFTKQNYYKIANKPIFSIYEIANFINGVGGIEQAKAALTYLDDKCKKAGFDGVHVQTMCWNLPQNVDSSALGGKASTSDKILKYLNVESMTTYNWIHYAGANDLDYKDWGAKGVSKWDEFNEKYKGIAYFAHVSIGWDNNARFPKSVYKPIVKNTNPKEFESFLRQAKEWSDKHASFGKKIITINAWNEWPEGSYLEPDQTNGFGYLEAVKRVFVDNK